MLKLSSERTFGAAHKNYSCFRRMRWINFANRVCVSKRFVRAMFWSVGVLWKCRAVQTRYDSRLSSWSQWNSGCAASCSHCEAWAQRTCSPGPRTRTCWTAIQCLARAEVGPTTRDLGFSLRFMSKWYMKQMLMSYIFFFNIIIVFLSANYLKLSFSN